MEEEEGEEEEEEEEEEGGGGGGGGDVVLLTYLVTYSVQPEGSLPHSKMSANCPSPEPARSSPYRHIPLSEDPSLYYPPIYALVAQVFCCPQVSPPKPRIRFSSPPYALHASPIPFFLILSPERYWLRSTDH